VIWTVGKDATNALLSPGVNERNPQPEGGETGRQLLLLRWLRSLSLSRSAPRASLRIPRHAIAAAATAAASLEEACRLDQWNAS
jgi:hypothetical protein